MRLHEHLHLPHSEAYWGSGLTSELHDSNAVNDRARLGAGVQERERLCMFAELLKHAYMIQQDLGHLDVVVRHVLGMAEYLYDALSRSENGVP